MPLVLPRDRANAGPTSGLKGRHMKRLIAAALVAGAVLTTSVSAASAGTIHQSATGPFLGSDFSTNWNQYLGSRFSIGQTTQITSIGGFVQGRSSPCISLGTCPDWDGEIFFALVGLYSPVNLPSFGPVDLETNTLAYATVAPPASASLITSSVDVILRPGDYAILIGSGAFGVFGNSEMTGGGTDAPLSSYFYANVATNTWYNGSFSGTQFVVEGNVVPIPAALPLLLSALGGLGFLGWRRKRMAAV